MKVAWGPPREITFCSCQEWRECGPTISTACQQGPFFFLVSKMHIKNKLLHNPSVYVRREMEYIQSGLPTHYLPRTAGSSCSWQIRREIYDLHLLSKSTGELGQPLGTDSIYFRVLKGWRNTMFMSLLLRPPPKGSQHHSFLSDGSLHTPLVLATKWGWSSCPIKGPPSSSTQLNSHLPLTWVCRHYTSANLWGFNSLWTQQFFFCAYVWNRTILSVTDLLPTRTCSLRSNSSCQALVCKR